MSCACASASGERTRQLADRLLVLLVLDFGEVAGDLEQHALVRRDRARRFLSQPLVEIGNLCVEDEGDLVEPASRNAIDPALVFMCLMICKADHIVELLML